MLVRRVRKVGNRLVITIPRKEAARLEITEGDFVAVEIRKATIRSEMSPDVRAAFERVFDPGHPDMRYLKDQ
jgi:antitoxin component of MazEF toxin-antitoxin module